MRHALHEVGLGTLEKHKKPLLTTKNVHCNLLKVINFGLSMIGIGNFSDETKIN